MPTHRIGGIRGSRRCSGSAADRRLGRRAFLVAGAASGVGAVLTACARTVRTSKGARPQVTTPTVTLVVDYVAPFVGWPETALSEFSSMFDPWRQQHPGVLLKVLPNSPYQGNLEAMLSGTAPDIIMDRDVSTLVGSKLLADLTPYLTKDKVDLSIFNSGQIVALSPGGHTYGLPAFTNVLVTTVNLGLLDGLGYSHPSPNWTFTEWATLARQLTVTSGSTPRRGASIFTPTNPNVGGQLFPAESYFRAWGGAYTDKNLGTTCTLDSTAAIDCANFFFPLMTQKVLAANCLPACFNLALNSGEPVSMAAEWSTPFAAAVAYQGLVWDYYPVPRGPAGSFSFTNRDFLGIWTGTKQPQLAWDLLFWMSVQPDFQRRMLLYTGYLPPLVSLQHQWIAKVRTVAPPLQDKNLEVYLETLPTAHPNRQFSVKNVNAEGLMGQWAQSILEQSTSPTGGMISLTRQIDALETAGG